MTAKAGNPEPKRKISDKLTEKLALFDQRGKKEARERQEADLRRGAQEKEKREKHIDCRGCWQDEEWEQEGTCPGYLPKDNRWMKASKRLSSPSTKGGCLGLRIFFSGPRRDETGPQRMEMLASRSVEAQTLESV